MSAARQNRLLAIGIIVATPLLIGFLAAIINSQPGEIAVALGGVLGGVIGAVGAALAVALTLSGERTEERRKEQERELRLINATVASIGSNITTLLTVVSQNIIPHYNDSSSAYKELRAAKSNVNQIPEVFESLSSKYRVFFTCPPLNFLTIEFRQDMLFIVDRDAELLMQGDIITSLIYQLKFLTEQRNTNIREDTQLRNFQGGTLNYYVFENVIQRHVSVGQAECAVAAQCLDKLLECAKTLQRINDKERGKKLILPPAFDSVVSELHKIIN